MQAQLVQCELARPCILPQLPGMLRIHLEGDVEMLVFRDNSQERILETFSMQKGGFLKTQGQDLCIERAAPAL